jgi:hypothetical protein
MAIEHFVFRNYKVDKLTAKMMKSHSLLSFCGVLYSAYEPFSSVLSYFAVGRVL